jgi:hypothetical protein
VPEKGLACTWSRGRLLPVDQFTKHFSTQKGVFFLTVLKTKHNLNNKSCF